jgi:hypothetical protein
MGGYLNQYTYGFDANGNPTTTHEHGKVRWSQHLLERL